MVVRACCRAGKNLVAVLLFALASLSVDGFARAEEINLVVLARPTISDETEGYFPLAPGVESVVRLAVEHINGDALLGEDNLTLSVVTSAQATTAAAGLCTAMETNTTVAVRKSIVFQSACSHYLAVPDANLGFSSCGDLLLLKGEPALERHAACLHLLCAGVQVPSSLPIH